MTTKYVDDNDRCWHVCPRCQGRDRGFSVWDDEMNRSHYFMGCQCEATRHPGEVWHFVEVPCSVVTGG